MNKEIIRKPKIQLGDPEYLDLIQKELKIFIQELKEMLGKYANKKIEECCQDKVFNSTVDKLLVKSLDSLKDKLYKPFDTFVSQFMVVAVSNPEDTILQSAGVRIYDTHRFYQYWKSGEEMIYIEEERRLISRLLIYDVLVERGILKENNVKNLYEFWKG